MFDEAFDENGLPRPHYAALIDQLSELDLAALRAAAQAEIDARGVAFTTASGTQPFVVDPARWRVARAGRWRGVGPAASQQDQQRHQPREGRCSGRPAHGISLADGGGARADANHRARAGRASFDINARDAPLESRSFHRFAFP